MRHLKIAVVAALAVAMVPEAASATMPLRNATEVRAFQARYGLSQTGVMDSSTQACASRRSCPPTQGGSTTSGSSSDSAICHNGVLSDDAGQGCADGLYERVYGSRAASPVASAAVSSPAVAPTTTGSTGYAGATPPQSIAQCESGGNPRAVSGNGMYRGKWQFSYSTWRSVGGTGDPAAASPAEQDRRAAMLYARSGSSPWPTCG